jgi:hypothetical protein
MKLIRYLLLAICLALPAGNFTGCGTLPRTPEARTFDTFKTTYNAAYTSYESYCKLVVKGKVTAAEEARVDAAWNDFRAAFSLSFRAASLNWSAATPEQIQLLANDLNKLIASLLNRL